MLKSDRLLKLPLFLRLQSLLLLLLTLRPLLTLLLRPQLMFLLVTKRLISIESC